MFNVRGGEELVGLPDESHADRCLWFLYQDVQQQFFVLPVGLTYLSFYAVSLDSSFEMSF